MWLCRVVNGYMANGPQQPLTRPFAVPKSPSQQKTRLDREYALHRRRATLLTLVYRGTRRADHKAKWVAGQTGELTPTVSRAGAVPAAANAREVVPSEAALVAAGMGLFQKVGGAAALPCTRLGLVVTKFVEMPGSSILNFFGAASAAAPKQQDGGAGVAAVAAVGAGASTSSPAKAKDGQKQQQEQEDEGAATIVVIDDSPPVTADDNGGGGGDGTGRTRPCAKCGGKAIAQEEWGEHADWHVAMDLQRAYGGGSGGGGAGAGGGSGGDRNDNKRPGPTGGQGARPGKQTKGGSGPKSQTLDKLWNKKK